MTLNIHLVNMPFGDLNRPSIGLTQLRSRLADLYKDDVKISIDYLNLEFARIIGPDVYQHVAFHQSGVVSGLGEWLFRRIAFSDLDDNSDAYMKRFGHQFGPDFLRRIRDELSPLRNRLEHVLDGLIETYQLGDADLVGLSSTFFQTTASLALARRLRHQKFDKVIVLGGANCEGVMGIELIGNTPDLDFSFSGHSLVSFPQFVGHLLAGDRDACHRIGGVFSRRNSRATSVIMLGGHADGAAPRPTADVAEMGSELDINTPIYLDYDDYFEAVDRLLPDANLRISALFETSRGCWWGERAHCTFCGLNGATMAYRAMKPDLAVSLIDDLIGRYRERTKLFECVDNIMPREYIDGVFGVRDAPNDVSIFYEVKADLTEAQLSTLSTGGVRLVQPGIESIATSTLKLMRKGTTSFGNIRFLMNCLEHGVSPGWNLLVGFPGEDAEVYAMYREVLPSLFHLPPPNNVFPVRFDRFSPYFANPERHGLKLKPYDFYGFVYPWTQESLSNIAYYFQDVNYDAEYIRDVAIALRGLREIIKQWRALWAQGTGMRPRLQTRQQSQKWMVDDTRSGKLVRSDLPPDEAELLGQLVRPVDRSNISAQDRAALTSLSAKQLVFSEHTRVMSLVSHVEAVGQRELEHVAV